MLRPARGRFRLSGGFPTLRASLRCSQYPPPPYPMPASSRRRFLRQAALAVPALALPTLAGCGTSRPAAPAAATAASPLHPFVKAPRLRPGQTVGVISPAGAVSSAETLTVLEQRLDALGLKMKAGAHALDRYGYLAGTDEARAADVNAMFADDDVDAVLAVRGGWGSARMLDRIDYDLVRRHPKVLVGFSDITALLLALYARTGLVTFHGPTGVSSFNPFTVGYLQRLLFDAEALTLVNPTGVEGDAAMTPEPVATITPGRARGRLVGGNLTVLATLMGSDYLPDWRGHILFLEDINEDVYRVDRMLTQLKLAGVLDGLTGLVFGACTGCDAREDGRGLTLDEVLRDHVAPLGIPAWRGAMIGHIRDKFTVPVGLPAEIDGAAGTIRLLEPAVR